MAMLKVDEDDKQTGKISNNLPLQKYICCVKAVKIVNLYFFQRTYRYFVFKKSIRGLNL